MNYLTLVENLRLDEAAKTSLSILECSDLLDESEFILADRDDDSLNEVVLSVPVIISIVLSAPGLIKILAKSFSVVARAIKKLFRKNKTKEGDSYAEKVINFTERWHESYIKVVVKTLTVAGVFKAAGISDRAQQEKSARVVFYTIVFGFAVFAGYASVQSIYHYITNNAVEHLSLGTAEAVLA